MLSLHPMPSYSYKHSNVYIGVDLTNNMEFACRRIKNYNAYLHNFVQIHIESFKVIDIISNKID